MRNTTIGLVMILIPGVGIGLISIFHDQTPGFWRQLSLVEVCIVTILAIAWVIRRRLAKR